MQGELAELLGSATLAACLGIVGSVYGNIESGWAAVIVVAISGPCPFRSPLLLRPESCTQPTRPTKRSAHARTESCIRSGRRSPRTRPRPPTARNSKDDRPRSAGEKHLPPSRQC